jgi:hypothetical protein
MSGKTINPPDSGHACQPGYEMRTDTIPSASMNPDAVVSADPYLAAPTIWSHPEGTAWRCDTCGGVWVSRGDRYLNQRGPVVFTPETWWERRRRTRGAS